MSTPSSLSFSAFRHQLTDSSNELVVADTAASANSGLVSSPKAGATPTPARMLGDDQPPSPQFTPPTDEEEDIDEERREPGLQNDNDGTDEEEQRRLRRERDEEDSMELARRLMAEEAMASYQQHFDLLRASAQELSEEDFAALQSALEDDEQEHVAALEDDNGELSYDAMLQIGERIGDVKKERWAMKAQEEIEKLPTFHFDVGRLGDAPDDSEYKCLVCQCEYEAGDELRKLPCCHCFHSECIGQWLSSQDVCPYCRQCIAEH